MTLSILIPTLENRWEQFEKLLSHLRFMLDPFQDIVIIPDNEKEIGSFTDGEVEIIYYRDNKQKTTGEKRQHLLEIAKGEYIVFIDCDDWVPDYYVSEILKALETKPDCLAINGVMYTDKRNPVKWFLSKDNLNRTVFDGGEPYYIRATNHITVVKKELALKAGFPAKSYGEDADYSIRLKQFLKTEVVIKLPLYEYWYSSKNKDYK